MFYPIGKKIKEDNYYKINQKSRMILVNNIINVYKERNIRKVNYLVFLFFIYYAKIVTIKKRSDVYEI